MKRWLAVMVLLLAAVAWNLPARAQEDVVQDAGQEGSVGSSLVTLSVARVETSSSYKPAGTSPYIDHALPNISLERMGTEWVEQNLAAGGDSGVLKAEVQEASISESFFQGKPYLFGMWSGEKYTEYNLNLIVGLKLYSGTSLLPEAEISVEVSRRGSIATDKTRTEHEKFIGELARDMMRDFDAEARRLVAEHFADYISK